MSNSLARGALRTALRVAASMVCITLTGFVIGCESLDNSTRTQSPREPLALDAEGHRKADALAYYVRGLMHEYEHEYDQALTNYESAALLDPANEELGFRIAMGLLQQKRSEEAIQLVERIRDENPTSVKPHLWLALIYRATGQRDRAIASYYKIIEIEPDVAAHYTEASTLLVKAGRDDEAVVLMSQAIERLGADRKLILLLANIHIRSMVSAADEAKATEHRRAAIRWVEKAVEQDEHDRPLLYQLGDLYILDEDMRKAIDCFAKIEKLYPGDMQVKRRLALSFMAVGDRQEAITSLESMIQDDPFNSLIYYYLGELYQQEGETEKALLNFAFSSKSDLPEPAPFIKRAVLQIEDNPQGAVEALREGLERLPDSIRLTEMLAYTYFSMKEYDSAAEFFGKTEALAGEEKAADITPQFYFNYGVALQQVGEIEEAAAKLARTVDDNAELLEAYVQYIFRSSSEREHSDAVRVLQHIAEERVTDPRPQLFVGMAHSYLKEYTEAILAYKEAVARFDAQDAPPEDFNAATLYFLYAAACERDGQLERAETLFEKCLDLDPEHADAYNYLAYMWAERGEKLEMALEFVQKALAVNPASGAFIDTLGWIYYMQGRYDDALVEIERAVQIIPDDPTIIDHLGDVLDKLGRESEALTKWKRSFVLEPGNEELADKLEQRGVDLDALRQEADALKLESDMPSADAAPFAIEPEHVPGETAE